MLQFVVENEKKKYSLNKQWKLTDGNRKVPIFNLIFSSSNWTLFLIKRSIVIFRSVIWSVFFFLIVIFLFEIKRWISKAKKILNYKFALWFVSLLEINRLLTKIRFINNTKIRYTENNSLISFSLLFISLITRLFSSLNGLNCFCFIF